MDSPSITAQAERPYVSTGHLPEPEMVQELVSEAQRRFKSNTDGQNSQVYPALARVPSELFGVCVVGTSGRVYAAGDDRLRILDHERVEAVRIRAGLRDDRPGRGARTSSEQTPPALPFNSLAAIERRPDGRTNPMVNAGAIATTSLVPGTTADEKWKFIHDGLSRFAGRKLPLNEEVYASASDTNFRNRSIARLLQSFDRIYCDAEGSDRSLHPAVLAECQRQGPRGHGRDAGRRRRQSRSPRSAWSIRRSATTRWR